MMNFSRIRPINLGASGIDKLRRFRSVNPVLLDHRIDLNSALIVGFIADRYFKKAVTTG